MGRALLCNNCGTEIPVEDPSSSVTCPECGDTYPLDFPKISEPVEPSSLPSEEEKSTEQRVITFYQSLGCTVYETSQAQKPVGMSKGIPDLIVFGAFSQKAPARFWFHEVKRAGADPRQTQRREQREFEEYCEAAGIPYVLGDATAAAQFFGFEVE